MVTGKTDRKDIDFIILLSTYLLNEDYSTIQDKMTKLAEQGQINAIQYFYLMKSEFEINQKIDGLLEDLLKTYNFELDVAIKNYVQAKHKTEYYFPEKYEGISKINQIDMDQLERRCFNKLKSKMKNKNDLILFERYLEIKILFGRRLTPTDKQNLKKVQSKLLSRYKEDRKNLKVAFALGKSLLLLGEDEAHKNLGKQILSEISKREISSQLEQAEKVKTKFLKNVKAKNTVKKASNKKQISEKIK